MKFRPKSIFSPKGAGKWSPAHDFLCFAMISYYILTTTILFLHSESRAKKLMGADSVYKCRKKPADFFGGYRALWLAMKLLPLTLRSPFHSGYECSRNWNQPQLCCFSRRTAVFSMEKMAVLCEKQLIPLFCVRDRTLLFANNIP